MQSGYQWSVRANKWSSLRQTFGNQKSETRYIRENNLPVKKNSKQK